MKKALFIAGALLAATQAQATATSDMSISIDWNSLAITGPLDTPTSFYDPFTGETFSSDGEGWVGSDVNELNSAYAIDGASAIASYTDPNLSLTGGYDSVTNGSGGSSLVTNSDAGYESGWAGSWHGFVYQASATGMVTVSIDYSLVGSVSTTASGEYANGGYDLFMDAVDADLWISTYNATIAGGGDELAAEDAAELAATLDVFSIGSWQLLECFGDVPCESSVNQSGVLDVAFNVEAGKDYFFGADATVYGYTDVSAVPVPAAVWLFGSGLIGLIGFAKRKKAA